MLSPSRASFYGRYAYRRQLPAEVLNSFGTETALLGQFVLVRFFETKPWETTLFFSLMHLSFFLSPWFAEQMRGRPTRPFFFVMMAISLPAFLATALTRGFWGIGPSLLVANIAFVAIFVPLRNRLMRSNYADAERGAAYATFKRTSALTFFGCALWAAHSLESDRSLIHVVLPIAGLLSAAGLYLFSRIRERGETWRLRSETDRPRRGFVDVYRDLFRLYRDEPGFRRYQIGFLIYGMGFMFTIPREMDIVHEVLHLDYDQIVLGIYGITPLVKMALLRPFGSLLDRAGPWKLAAIAFSLLAIYPLSIYAAVAFESTILWYVARASFGLAMGGVDIAWSVGPLSFGPRERASAFTAAHVFAVGIRATIGPALGHLVWHFAGEGVFFVAACILIVAGLFMRNASRRPIAA